MKDDFYNMQGFEDDISLKQEEYANFIPLLIPIIAAPLLAGGLGAAHVSKQRKEAKELGRQTQAEIQKRRAEGEQAANATISFSPVVTLNCNELEKQLAIANNTLADAYNLTESQSRQWGERKGLIEKRIFSLDCAGKKQAAEKAKIDQTVGEQAIRLAAEKKATQKKILLYGGIGVGVIAALVTVILIARAGK
jgi:hypothetical protein